MEGMREYFQRDALACHLGIELVDVSPGTAVARMAVGKHHCNSYGLVHGAAIFALADVAFQAAANAYGTLAVALNVSITFVRPGGKGVLTARAGEVSAGKTTANYDITVANEEGKTVALFRGLVYRKGDPLPFAAPNTTPADASG